MRKQKGFSRDETVEARQESMLHRALERPAAQSNSLHTKRDSPANKSNILVRVLCYTVAFYSRGMLVDAKKWRCLSRRIQFFSRPSLYRSALARPPRDSICQLVSGTRLTSSALEHYDLVRWLYCGYPSSTRRSTLP